MISISFRVIFRIPNVFSISFTKTMVELSTPAGRLKNSSIYLLLWIKSIPTWNSLLFVSMGPSRETIWNIIKIDLINF